MGENSCVRAMFCENITKTEILGETSNGRMDGKTNIFKLIQKIIKDLPMQ